MKKGYIKHLVKNTRELGVWVVLKISLKFSDERAETEQGVGFLMIFSGICLLVTSILTALAGITTWMSVVLSFAVLTIGYLLYNHGDYLEKRRHNE